MSQEDITLRGTPREPASTASENCVSIKASYDDLVQSDDGAILHGVTETLGSSINEETFSIEVSCGILGCNL